ncbi:hypothetical protein KIM372_01820 [Bombiscardovia nodaiensis]|uniref:Uncharacterized protein n=1 Tax=Bombiscardovia nodaiensis TaxID=2932181 RepID=A0ABN6S7S9_9BIFI|nr:hypothetical protein KIM372_01820 [Bombiscardovia nodaiensis]
MSTLHTIGTAMLALSLTVLGGGHANLAAARSAQADPTSSSAQTAANSRTNSPKPIPQDPSTQPNNSVSTPPVEHEASPAPQPKAQNSVQSKTQPLSQPKLTPRGGSCTIDVSTIAQCLPDSNLASAVATSIGKAPSDTLTTAIINSTTKFGYYDEALKSKNIVSVEGLQYFTKLKNLSLDGNQITDLSPLTNMPELSILYASGNPIVSLGTLSNPNLTELALQDCTLMNVSSIAWSNLTKLQQLNLGSNQITDLSPLDPVHSLTGLSASGNQISNLGQLNDPNLINLDLHDNKITSISNVNWSRLTKLSTIKFGDNQTVTDFGSPGRFNQITDLSPLNPIHSLTSLDACCNPITNLGTLDDPNLIELYLRFNKLTSTSNVSWSTNTKIQILYLDDNQITDLSSLEPIHTLSRLHASNNLITNAGQLNNPNLDELFLANNELPSIASINWSASTRISRLDLCNNRITDLSPLDPIHSLYNLDASNNLITNAGQLNNPLLNALDLGTNAGTIFHDNWHYPQKNGIVGNKLTSIASVNWSALTGLQKLWINNNDITDLSPVTGLPTLYQLDATSNLISTLGQLNNPKLGGLYLGDGGSIFGPPVPSSRHRGNKLTSIASVNWSALTRLQALYLDNNQISDLSPLDQLHTLNTIRAENNLITNPGQLNDPSIVLIYLQNNKLTSSSLSSISWATFTNLQELRLDSNQITRLDTVNWTTIAPTLTTLNLRDNQITDVSSVNWNLFIRITNSGIFANGGCSISESAVCIRDQRVRLPDLPGYSPSPLTLGPATISHSPDTFATPWVESINGTQIESKPAGGSYTASDGTYTWAHSNPGDHTYAFKGTINLPNATKPSPFNGTISQRVPGFVVTFDPQGGTLHTSATVAISAAGPISEPAPPPTYEGKIFAGWYTSPTSPTRWNFSQDVTADMTLYARWAPIMTLPQAGAIPLQQWSGGGLLVASALATATYGRVKLSKRKHRPGRHAQNATASK